MKRIIGTILSIALVLSMITVPVNHTSASADSNIASQTTDVIPEGYIPIYTMDDLVAVNKNPDGYERY